MTTSVMMFRSIFVSQRAYRRLRCVAHALRYSGFKKFSRLKRVRMDGSGASAAASLAVGLGSDRSASGSCMRVVIESEGRA
jgi:hypothetical protein